MIHCTQTYIITMPIVLIWLNTIEKDVKTQVNPSLFGLQNQIPKLCLSTDVTGQLSPSKKGLILILLHSEMPKLYVVTVLAVMSAIGLKERLCSLRSHFFTLRVQLRGCKKVAELPPLKVYLFTVNSQPQEQCVS